jgi:hypothetical protein
MIETPFKPIEIYSTIIEDNDMAIEDYREILDAFNHHNLFSTSEGIVTDYHHAESHKYRLETWANLCLDYLGDAMEEFSKHVNEALDFSTIWTQITNKSNMHHPHSHGERGYSFVWYIDVDPEVHEPTYYLNPSPPYDYFKPELEKGKLLIWPSHVLHYQPPSNSDVDRYIISGNLKIRD